MIAVHLEQKDHVATLTLDDRARKNAMSTELGDALSERVHELCTRADLRAVVLTGAGGAFSGGGDFAMLERLRSEKGDAAKQFMLAFYARYLSILDLPCPVIAAVVGPAIGAGLCVALACHLMVVDEDAKLALNFASLGLYPGMGATYFAPRRLGAQRAGELLLTGRRFDGREAVSMGMALEARTSGDVLARAEAIAAQIAKQGPLATRALTRTLGPDPAALRAALEQEAEHQAESYASVDLGEGLLAAQQRRPAVFRGV